MSTLSIETLSKYASKLPIDIKVKILSHLQYTDVMFITDPYFWSQYWEHYNHVTAPPNPLLFKPNPEQEYVLELIESGKNVFINSPAGTGKSALMRYFKNTCSSKVIGLTSTTGISALNIGGSTLHSFLGIGLGNDHIDDLYERIMKIREKYELWCSLNILIIDEISMLHPTLFDKLEKLARLVRENNRKFGGIQLVVTGDLFQLPCVSRNSALIIHSRRFKRCIDHVVEFRNILRQNDHIFKSVLNKIRLGIIDPQVKQVLKSRFLKAPKDPNTNLRPTKLFCTKKAVDYLNEKELNKLAQKGFEFREYQMVFKEHQCPVSFDYIAKNFAKNSTTPTTLCLAEETQVMLTYNISPVLVNGSRGVVIGFDQQDYPIVEFVGGRTSTIVPIKFNLHHTLPSGKIISVGYATQVPLKIAYALTIHSCQGSTLDYVSIDLRETFEYGQAYTALSRVRTLEGLYAKKFNFDVIKAHPDALKFIGLNPSI